MTTTSDHIPAARSRKALWLGVALGAAVITLFLLGKTGVLGSLEAFIAHMQDMADTPVRTLMSSAMNFASQPP